MNGDNSYSNARNSAPFGLQHDAWGRLVMIDAAGHRHVGVEPVRAFPVSDPEHYISLCNAEGHELVCVQDLGELAPAVREVLNEELARREFIPVLQRIENTSSDNAPANWDVQTDRGPTRFVLNSEDDVRQLGPHRALVIDADGIRYLVPDLRKLDAFTRKVLDRYL